MEEGDPNVCNFYIGYQVADWILQNFQNLKSLEKKRKTTCQWAVENWEGLK